MNITTAPIPLLSLHGPTHFAHPRRLPLEVRVQGSLPTSPALDSSGSGRASPCGEAEPVQAGLVYKWEEVRPAGSMRAPVVLLATPDPRILSVAAATLEVGASYSFRCTVTALAPSIGTAVQVVEVVTVTADTPLVAIIKGGAERSLAPSLPLMLDGRPSLDPEQVPLAPSYNWTCLDVAGPYTEAVQLADMVAAGNATAMLGWPDCALPDEQLASSAMVTLPANALAPSSTVLFVLRYAVGKRVAYAAQLVQVLPAGTVAAAATIGTVVRAIDGTILPRANTLAPGARVEIQVTVEPETAVAGTRGVSGIQCRRLCIQRFSTATERWC